MKNKDKFIYKIEKNELDEHIEIRTYYTDESKTGFVDITKQNYQILMKRQEFESLNIKSDKIILSNEELFCRNKKIVVKLDIKSKELYDYLRKEIKDNELSIFEADLPEEHKILIENKENISNSKKDDFLKYLSIDIETIGNVENQEIVLISSFSPDSKEMSIVYVNKEKIDNKKLKEVLKFKDKTFICKFGENEKEILELFQQDIIEFKPQVLIGWNVIDFDFKVIRDRMKTLSIPFKFSDSTNPCKLRIQKDFFRDSTMDCSGILVFDIIQILKSNYIVFEDYKLNTVAKKVLDDEKIDLEDDENDISVANKIKAIENMLKKDPINLIKYNFKDSILVSRIVEKLNLMKLMEKRSSITNTPIARVKSPIATLDIMYLEELHKRGFVADSNFNFDNSNPIEGAFVVEPKKGFYEDIFVLDFKSLYPSIIMTFNIDPFTIDNEKGTIEAPNNAKFTSKPGILPELILRLYKERDIAKQEKDDIKSYALKITMNSFYGAVASPKSRFHNKDVGGAITSFGRFIIQKAAAFVEDEQIGDIVYGDTDSIFVKIKGLEGKSLEEKKKAGFELENDLNKYFNEWVSQEFGQKNYLTIEFEKLYSKFFIASKKRYVGFDEFTQKTSFVGMEAVRGDWTELAKRFQVNLVNLIFETENEVERENKIKEFIKNEIKKLKSGKYDNLLIYNKKLTKPLVEYTKTTPPHVKAARKVSGFDQRLVKYVQLKDGPTHISLLGPQVNYDYEHYIKKQLMGVSDDLLEEIGIDFKAMYQSTKQNSLNRFF